MNAAVPQIIVAEVTVLMQTDGYITADGNYDPAKWENVAADSAFAQGVVAIFQKHGVPVPPNVLKIIAAVPAIVGALPFFEQIAGILK